MIDLINTYILLYPKLFIFFEYPSYVISIIFGIILIYKFRVTGILLLLHSLIFLLLLSYDNSRAFDPSYYDEMKFNPHIWTIPILGTILIPTLIIIGIVIDRIMANKRQIKK